jgi:hypothetical protein
MNAATDIVLHYNFLLAKLCQLIMGLSGQSRGVCNKHTQRKIRLPNIASFQLQFNSTLRVIYDIVLVQNVGIL